MKRYANIHEGAIQSVEVSVTPESLQACMKLRDKDSQSAIENKLSEMGYNIVSRTTVNQHPMLVVAGPRDEGMFIKQLSRIDGPLNATKEKKPFDAWKVRSILGFGGQILQLSSSIMKGKMDKPLFIFAGTNLAANTMNLVYKSQKRDDTYQLRALKEAINHQLTPMLDEGVKPIDINDSRALLREGNRPKPLEPVDDFMRKHSVTVGELGLRFVGAVNLAYPARDWTAAVKEGRMPHLDPRPLRVFAGAGSTLGKAVAKTSLIPDPYNPQPTGWWHKMREKYTFLTGGLIEAVAFSALTYDSFANTKPVWKDGIVGGTQINSHALKWKSAKHGYASHDWLSTIGGAMFVTGYIVRSWAKFGERKVDMNELYAHSSDMISRLPPEKIPQALADTSAYIANHFKGQRGTSFGAVYGKISDDLAHEHQIIINPKSHHVTVSRNPSTGIEVTQVHPSNEIHTVDVEHTAPTPSVATEQQRA